jgi:hypothetical protein
MRSAGFTPNNKELAVFPNAVELPECAAPEGMDRPDRDF